MTASGDFLSKDLFCQPQQQPDLLISRPLKDVFQSFSCLFHHFLPFSTKTPFIFRSYFRLEPSRKYAYTVNIHFNLYCKEVCPQCKDVFSVQWRYFPFFYCSFSSRFSRIQVARTPAVDITIGVPVLTIITMVILLIST
nr:MAG TPA: protein of unknown function (DUF2256) [Caudoviricetes sp.]